VILVTGGTGFVGTQVVHTLRAATKDVRCLVRSPDRAERLEAWGCELAVGDVTDVASLARAVAGCDAIVHLVSIIEGKAADFDRVMTRATADLVTAAATAGVGRLVLMSALRPDEPGSGDVPYYAAKAQMEAAVHDSGIPHAILQPSFAFGRGGALPRFIRIVRYLPVTPVPGPGTQLIQPIWVDDVARACLLVLDREDNLVVELGGPDVLSWNELWQRIAQALHKRRRLLHLPFSLLRPQAAVFERLPKPPLTRDQLSMLALGDNVVRDGGAGMARISLTDLVPLDEQLRRSL
jgi:uncharacterized protein YbjT (DUF2867 family)